MNKMNKKPSIVKNRLTFWNMFCNYLVTKVWTDKTSPLARIFCLYTVVIREVSGIREDQDVSIHIVKASLSFFDKSMEVSYVDI